MDRMNPTGCFVFDLRPDQRPTKPMASRRWKVAGPRATARIPLALCRRTYSVGPHAEDSYDARADPMCEASRVENSIAERPLCATTAVDHESPLSWIQVASVLQ